MISLLLLLPLVLTTTGYYIEETPLTFFTGTLIVYSTGSGEITVGLLDSNNRDFGKISISSGGLKVNINHNCPDDTSEYPYEFEDHYIEGGLAEGTFTFSYDRSSISVFLGSETEMLYEVGFNQSCMAREQVLVGWRLEEGEPNSAVEGIETADVHKDYYSNSRSPGGFKKSNIRSHETEGVLQYALESCPAGTYSSQEECVECPEGTLSKKESSEEYDCVEYLPFPRLPHDQSRHRETNLVKDIYDPVWPLSSRTKLSLSILNNHTYPDTEEQCNLYIVLEGIETELTLVRVGGEVFLETELGSGESTTTSLESRGLYVISVVFGEGEFVVLEDGVQRGGRHSYNPVSPAGDHAVVFIEENPSCLSFLDEESSVGFVSVEEMEELFSKQEKEVIEDALPATLCRKPMFVDCDETLLFLDSPWSEFQIKSLIIKDIPETHSIVAQSDNTFNYTVNDLLYDSHIGDGHGQDEFFLEADNGKAIIELTYITREIPSVEDKELEVGTLEPPYVPAAPAEIATMSPEEIAPPTYKPEEEQDEVMKEFVMSNTISFKLKKSVDVEDIESEDEDDEDIPEDEKMKVIKIDFGDSKIPVNYLKTKSEEYEKKRDEVNVLGFLAENGFTDSGIIKSFVRKKEAEGRSTDEINSMSISRDDLQLDQESMVESIKMFQKFNGFPETGEISEEQLELTTIPRCGNPDMYFKDEQDQFTCVENPGVKRSDRRWSKCGLDKKHFLDICEAYPASFITDKSSQEQRNFVKAKAYFLELDINFKDKKQGKKVSHVGVAFNFNEHENSADYIIIAHESRYKRLCFSYGTYTNNIRKERAKLQKCMQFTGKEQRVMGKFKATLSVYEKEEQGTQHDASLSINGRRVFFMNTTMEILSSAYIFTLGGSNYNDHYVSVFTSRICRRRTAWTKKHRSKRYLLSNFKWNPNGEPMTYAFANYSSSLGEELTRQEVLRAINLYAHTGIYFEEYSSNKLTVADLTFMFIRGKHADGTTFYGAGAEKAHAYTPFHGEIHFNDHENFVAEKKGVDPVSMFWVALHEIGHALGIRHSAFKDAVMQPAYTTETAFAQQALDVDDLNALREQYGSDYEKYTDRTEYLLANNLQEPLIRFLEASGGDVNDYGGRLPIPASCLNKIETAFYYYDRDGIVENDRLYLLSYGLTWAYQRVGDEAWPWSMVKGFPKRTDKQFKVGSVAQFDAAFDNGKYVYLIAQTTVFVTEYFSTGYFHLVAKDEMRNVFDGLDTPVRDAFMSAKTECQSKADTTCRETTFIVDDNISYRINWKKKGKVIAKGTKRAINTVDITGEDISASTSCKFQAVTEIGTYANRIMCFNGRYMFQRYFYPNQLGYGDGSSQKRGVSEAPTNFQISGWCVE